MKKAAWATLAGALAVSATLPAFAAAEFSLGYDVDRFPARQLSMQKCHEAVARGASALGYSTRVDQDQKTLVLHVSAPRADGRSLISYCISAGDQTVFVIQAFDYSGPGNPDVDKVKQRVGAEVRKAAAAR
ncbi:MULTISPECIES: DUF6180 family protein [Stenotrophomonas]|uniref:DUF6180 family protein n=1 Tax=Stenotrophomonas TaxID=40323 RepID=UPI00114C9415|nr:MULTISPECIES: DUF6180 family protein [Stenotrophomonas]